ncbi:MAG TPA: ABC transporter substrate-binding protein [Phycisphaerae bacterium]|nr:ABC transporter substrate-binding protein [Phycisphaerae bacterium]
MIILMSTMTVTSCNLIARARLILTAIFSLLCLALALFCTGCRRPPSVTADNLPRIISTVPAATQILIQIGGAYTLVGVSSYDPPLLKPPLNSLPVVGDYMNLDYELLLVLHPTALIIQMAPSRVPSELTEFTQEHQIHLVNLPLTTLDQMYQSARVLGQISGREKQAAGAVTALEAHLAQISAHYATAWHPRVIYIEDAQPLRIVGSENFMDAMITLAGGQNVGTLAGVNSPVIDRETLVDLAPDVLLIAAPGQKASTGPDDPRISAWSDLSLPAAEYHRIYLMRSPGAEMPTLNIDAQVQSLAKMIHLNPPVLEPQTQPQLPAKGEL